MGVNRRHNFSAFLYDQYKSLVLQRKRHRVLWELRRFKNQKGNWPAYWMQIKDNLPDDVLCDVTRDVPLIHFLSDKSFVFYNSLLNGQGDDTWEILVKDQDLPSFQESRMLDRFLQPIIERLPTYKRDSTWHRNLICMAPDSVQVLIKNLNHSNADIRCAVIDLLGRIAQTRRTTDIFSIADGLVAGFKNEPDCEIKKAYIRALGCFSDITSKDYRTALQSLFEILDNSENRNLRIAAARSLVTSARNIESVYSPETGIGDQVKQYYRQISDAVYRFLTQQWGIIQSDSNTPPTSEDAKIPQHIYRLSIIKNPKWKTLIEHMSSNTSGCQLMDDIGLYCLFGFDERTQQLIEMGLLCPGNSPLFFADSNEAWLIFGGE